MKLKEELVEGARGDPPGGVAGRAGARGRIAGRVPHASDEHGVTPSGLTPCSPSPSA